MITLALVQHPVCQLEYGETLHAIDFIVYLLLYLNISSGVSNISSNY